MENAKVVIELDKILNTISSKKISKLNYNELIYLISQTNHSLKELKLKLI